MDVFKPLYASLGVTGAISADGVLRFLQSPDLRGAVLACVSLGAAGFVARISVVERRRRGEIALKAEEADSERMAKLLDALGDRLVGPLGDRLAALIEEHRPDGGDDPLAKAAAAWREILAAIGRGGGGAAAEPPARKSEADRRADELLRRRRGRDRPAVVDAAPGWTAEDAAKWTAREPVTDEMTAHVEAARGAS